MDFKLVSNYQPTGDQPEAIAKLVKGIKEGKKDQVLLGATGTGKTFTIANVIARVNKPTLVFAHNKTLAGQLYSEFKELFPHNRVEYFVSNFDYYQPEAYMPKTDTYIEKSAVTNEEIDMLRMSAYNSLLERRDTIVVASVACIYASSDPSAYKNMFFTLKVGDEIDRKELLKKLVQRQYQRNDVDNLRGTFKVKGDVIELTPGYTDEFLIRIELFDDTIERITEIDPVSKDVINGYLVYNFFPASGYARNREDILRACDTIESDHPAGDCQSGLRHRTGAQPHPGGGVLPRDHGPICPGRGGHRGAGRGGVQCDPGPAGGQDNIKNTVIPPLRGGITKKN